jgi:hypothetical protein
MMRRSSFFVTPFAAVAIFIGATVFTTEGAGVAAVASEPCAPNLTPPTEPTPAAPGNLRILRGGGTEAELLEPEFEEGSGPFVPEASTATAVSGSHAYFDALINRADCLTSFHFRTQANVDLVPSRAESDAKIPIVYDSTHDAAKFEIDPSGSLPHSGSTGTPQKRLPIPVNGSSMLLTWDLKIAESMRYKSTDYLSQHKSHRIDDPTAAPWLGMKQNYAKGTNQGKGIAEFFFTSSTKWHGPGTSAGNSETIQPTAGEFFIQPNTWTRVWVFLDGNIGNPAGTPVQMSVWLADENRGPVQLYNKVSMITPPADGLGIFRYEFDSSTKEASNGPGQQWQRNFVVLRGVTHAQVLSLLQKPAP